MNILNRWRTGREEETTRCHICGEPAEYHCDTCGRFVCLRHTVIGTATCAACLAGTALSKDVAGTGEPGEGESELARYFHEQAQAGWRGFGILDRWETQLDEETTGCHICGQPAEYHCSGCGKLVCSWHTVPVPGTAVCTACLGAANSGFLEALGRVFEAIVVAVANYVNSLFAGLFTDQTQHKPEPARCHVCGELPAYRCDSCGKPICQAHTVMGTATCRDCLEGTALAKVTGEEARAVEDGFDPIKHYHQQRSEARKKALLGIPRTVGRSLSELAKGLLTGKGLGSSPGGEARTRGRDREP